MNLLLRLSSDDRNDSITIDNNRFSIVIASYLSVSPNQLQLIGGQNRALHGFFDSFPRVGQVFGHDQTQQMGGVGTNSLSQRADTIQGNPCRTVLKHRDDVRCSNPHSVATSPLGLVAISESICNEVGNGCADRAMEGHVRTPC